jgi:hypothetical protein
MRHWRESSRLGEGRRPVNGGAGETEDRFDGPVTVDLLADLQAGLLDDRTAADVRRRARTDPEVARRLAILDRVRRDVAHLGVDAASAPDIPADVTARVGAAVGNQLPQAQGLLASRGAPSAHAARAVRFRTAAAALGLAAAVGAVAVGATMLLRPADPHTPSSTTASQPPGGLPLTDPEILGLLTQTPDPGSLADPARRASCFNGLGYPTDASVLGARPLDVRGRPGVLFLLAGDAPGRIDAVVVGEGCSAADSDLLARTVLGKP